MVDLRWLAIHWLHTARTIQQLALKWRALRRAVQANPRLGFGQKGERC
jgi:hypothetical protein